MIAASPTLASVFQDLAEMPTPAFRLSLALQSVNDCFDYALIDCPPALGHATANALTASDVVLVPLQCEFLSMRGLHDMKDITAIIRDTTNPGLLLRVLGTMFDKRTLHANAVLQEANRDLPGLVFQTVIPRTIRLAEAPAMGKNGGTDAKVMQGGLCTECGNYTVIKKDGCEFCTACGAVGACG